MGTTRLTCFLTCKSGPCSDRNVGFRIGVWYGADQTGHSTKSAGQNERSRGRQSQNGLRHCGSTRAWSKSLTALKTYIFYIKKTTTTKQFMIDWFPLICLNKVIWYHKDRPVKESSDFQLIFQGDRCSLIIREAFQEDSGLYRVVAVNSAGEASSHCQLVVSRNIIL